MNTRTPKTKKAPTEAQLRFLLELHGYIRAHQIAPSYEDLVQRLGINKSAVSQAAGRLRRDGYISNPTGSARYRNLTLTDAGTRAVRAEQRKAVAR